MTQSLYPAASGAEQTSVKDSSSDFDAHVSHFGVLKAGPTILSIKGNFPGSALNETVWQDHIENSAALTLAEMCKDEPKLVFHYFPAPREGGQ